MLLVKEAGKRHIACEKQPAKTHFACEQSVQVPVRGTTHGIVTELGWHPLCSLPQERAYCCVCDCVTDDLTPMSHPTNDLHQLH